MSESEISDVSDEPEKLPPLTKNDKIDEREIVFTAFDLGDNNAIFGG